ncbi:DUF305 domain-containing protein [Nocardia higoensis]|uniref:DUF305 domain-containing protein n=1 Tax=Nocardia higoensis TaxID=228599 RepID=A0ABS0DB91_9NOCA|nr:DUF305 domain-containing protein [Nocardia higoensis]MBF6355735.1 DUF305 domain-containing protein [Nocardia higoensis]
MSAADGTDERRSWRVRVAALAAAMVCVAAGVLIGWFARGDGGAGASGGEQVMLADADIAFAQQMSAHHQQALTMVEMLGPDAAPEVRAAAEQIRISQWREVGTLTGWLELVGAPVQPTVEQGAHDGHGGHGGDGEAGAVSGMAGMASDEELTRLYHAPGPAREVLFLQLMIRHHQGGVDMAAAGAQATDSAAVRARALSMLNGQQQEISTLSVLLSQRGAEVLAYP